MHDNGQTQQQSARKPGRPKGAKTAQAEVTDKHPSRCPVCGSTAAESTGARPTIVNRPGLVDGRPFTRIVFRRIRCKACGQVRVEREFMYTPQTEIV